jgi:hypothetical protein
MILRSQLIVLLKNKIFNESAEIWNFKQISLKMFRDEYPRYPTIQVLALFYVFVYLFITCIELDMILMKGLKLFTINNYASVSVMDQELYKLLHVFVESVWSLVQVCKLHAVVFLGLFFYSKDGARTSVPMKLVRQIKMCLNET